MQLKSKHHGLVLKAFYSALCGFHEYHTAVIPILYTRSLPNKAEAIYYQEKDFTEKMYLVNLEPLSKTMLYT